MVPRPFYETIRNERERIKGRSIDELLAIIEKEARGPNSKRILREGLEYESPAHIYYSSFRCPPVIDRGRGAIVWDVDGNEYIDLISGFAVENLGHSHPKIVEAIKNQCEKLTQYAELPNELRTELAKKLVEITPGDHEKKVYYSVTGGEAVEFSIKLARYYTGRPRIMAFYGAYHGRTYGAMNATANAYLGYFQGFPLGIGVVHVPYAYCYRCPFDKEYPDCGMQCTKFIEEHFKCNQYGIRYENPKVSVNNVAAILVEPMQGPAGYIVPPREFLQDLRKIADDYNLLLICDEIQTGWGRTGKWWGCDHSEVVPDVMPISKSIAGGIPLSATVARAEIMDELGPAAHSTTFGGYPLACAVGLAAIEVFKEERLVDRAAEMGKYFMSDLNDLADERPVIGNVNGKGLFIGVELVKDRRTKKPAAEEATLIQSECLKEGLLFEIGGYYGNIIKIISPLTVEKGQIDKAIEILSDALRVV